MADIYDRDTKRVLRSKNTPDFAGNPRYIVLPHRRDQPQCPVKYWKDDVNRVVEMSESEKEAVDTAEDAEREAAEAAAERAALIVERARENAEEAAEAELIAEGIINGS